MASTLSENSTIPLPAVVVAELGEPLSYGSSYDTLDGMSM